MFLLEEWLNDFGWQLKKCHPAAIRCCFTAIGDSTHVFQKKTYFFLFLGNLGCLVRIGFYNGLWRGRQCVGVVTRSRAYKQSADFDKCWYVLWEKHTSQVISGCKNHYVLFFGSLVVSLINSSQKHVKTKHKAWIYGSTMIALDMISISPQCLIYTMGPTKKTTT